MGGRTRVHRPGNAGWLRLRSCLLHGRGSHRGVRTRSTQYYARCVRIVPSMSQVNGNQRCDSPPAWDRSDLGTEGRAPGEPPVEVRPANRVSRYPVRRQWLRCTTASGRQGAARDRRLMRCGGCCGGQRGLVPGTRTELAEPFSRCSLGKRSLGPTCGVLEESAYTKALSYVPPSRQSSLVKYSTVQAGHSAPTCGGNSVNCPLQVCQEGLD